MRRRILLLVAGITVLVVLAFAIPLAVLIGSQASQRARSDAVNEANSIALSLRAGSTSQAAIESQLAKEHVGDVSVVLPDGTIVGDSLPAAVATSTAYALPTGNAPGQFSGGTTPGDPNRDGDRTGPQTQLQPVAGGGLAVVAVPASSGFYVVRVFLSDGAARSGAVAWWALLAGGSVVLLVVGIAGGELVTRRIVRPLLDTAQTAHRIAAGDVTARAPASGPREIAEVGTALNRLADRIDELIAEERETVADLSHRLRTPLTALRLDAEALNDPAEAERVGNHVSALERMLTAVIRAARRPQREGRLPSCDAHEVVAGRVEFWSALADDQGRASTVSLPTGPLMVRAAAEDLAAAVDALLENVVAHTPEGTSYAVSLTATETGGRLRVTDEGPGLSDETIVRGRSDRGSSGLGLDIARRCAEASGGAMRIGAAPGGGASIELDLGAP